MKKILLEGGNVSFYHPQGNLVDKKGKTYFKSDEMNVTADSTQPEGTDHNNISYVQNEIHGLMTGIHNEFQKDHGEELFGKNAEGLGKPGKKNKNTIYSGSTAHLTGASGVDPESFVQAKAESHGVAKVGDLDTAINPAHGDKLKQTLERLAQQNTRVGNYTVVGHAAKGNEIHALVRHDNGKMHQVDFNKTVGLGSEPNEDSLFPTSHSQQDLENGYKGVVHKLMLNAAGMDRYKFSLYGLGDRSAPELPSKASSEEKLAHAQANYIRNPQKVAQTLFPNVDGGDTEHIKHTEGVSYLLGKHGNGVNFSDIYDGDSGIAAGLRQRGFSDKKIADHRKRLQAAFDLGRSGEKYKPSARDLKESVIGGYMAECMSFSEWKQLQEVLTKEDPVKQWIDDFIKSDNPKFAGKSKKERINMALGAYYANQKENK